MADHVATPVTGAAREPAAVIGLVITAVTSILALLVAFGVDLTQDQQVAILGVIAGVGPLVAALLIRGRVSPTSTVVAQATAHGDLVAGGASVQPAGSTVRPEVIVGQLAT